MDRGALLLEVGPGRVVRACRAGVGRCSVRVCRADQFRLVLSNLALGFCLPAFALLFHPHSFRKCGRLVVVDSVGVGDADGVDE